MVGVVDERTTGWGNNAARSPTGGRRLRTQAMEVAWASAIDRNRIQVHVMEGSITRPAMTTYTHTAGNTKRLSTNRDNVNDGTVENAAGNFLGVGGLNVVMGSNGGDYTPRAIFAGGTYTPFFNTDVMQPADWTITVAGVTRSVTAGNIWRRTRSRGADRCSNVVGTFSQRRWHKVTFLINGAAIADGQTVVITPTGGYPPISFVMGADALTNAIKINRLGWHPNQEEKIATVGDWFGHNASGVEGRTSSGGVANGLYAWAVAGEGGTPWEMRKSGTNTVVLTGNLILAKASNSNHNTTSGANWNHFDALNIDASSWTTPGNYYFYIAGMGRSPDFTISERVWDQLIFHSRRDLYISRKAKEIEDPWAMGRQLHGPEAATADVPKKDTTVTIIQTDNGPNGRAQDGSNDFVEVFIAANSKNRPNITFTFDGGHRDAADNDNRPDHIQTYYDELCDIMEFPDVRLGKTFIPQDDLADWLTGVSGVTITAADYAKFPDGVKEVIWGLQHWIRIPGNMKCGGEEQSSTPEHNQVVWSPNRYVYKYANERWSTYCYIMGMAKLAMVIERLPTLTPAPLGGHPPTQLCADLSAWVKGRAIASWNACETGNYTGNEQPQRARAAAVMYRLTGGTNYMAVYESFGAFGASPAEDPTNAGIWMTEYLFATREWPNTGFDTGQRDAILANLNRVYQRSSTDFGMWCDGHMPEFQFAISSPYAWYYSGLPKYYRLKYQAGTFVSNSGSGVTTKATWSYPAVPDTLFDTGMRRMLSGQINWALGCNPPGVSAVTGFTDFYHDEPTWPRHNATNKGHWIAMSTEFGPVTGTLTGVKFPAEAAPWTTIPIADKLEMSYMAIQTSECGMRANIRMALSAARGLQVLKGIYARS